MISSFFLEDSLKSVWITLCNRHNRFIAESKEHVWFMIRCLEFLDWLFSWSTSCYILISFESTSLVENWKTFLASTRALPTIFKFGINSCKWVGRESLSQRPIHKLYQETPCEWSGLTVPSFLNEVLTSNHNQLQSQLLTFYYFLINQLTLTIDHRSIIITRLLTSQAQRCNAVLYRLI